MTPWSFLGSLALDHSTGHTDEVGTGGAGYGLEQRPLGHGNRWRIQADGVGLEPPAEIAATLTGTSARTMRSTQASRRTRRRLVRLLQALLVSLALVVVVTPPAGAGFLGEAPALVAGAAGRVTPVAAQSARSVTPLRLPVTRHEPPFLVALEPAAPSCLAPVLARNILRITSRLLC